MVDCGGLENRYPVKAGSWVRIPLSPPECGSTLKRGCTVILKNIKNNWKAGLAVALVSIPLSISLAVASGASPTAGIITAIWAGLIASLVGGSNFNIVGPTGALSGIVAGYAFIHGMQAITLLTIIASLFILLAYALKLERYLIFIPSSVIHGFTLGVAFIIGLNQLNYALGLKNLPHHDRLLANLLESLEHIYEVSPPTILIFASFFCAIILLRFISKKIPGTIVVTPFGIALGYLSKNHLIPINLETLGEKFSDISFKLFVQPTFAWYPHILQTAAIVALIAILETMLSAKIADSMTHTKHNPRKEMLGLGLANLVSGFFGGIPATAALARTSLNIKAHATTKMAATINVVFIALISFFLLSYFTYIPLAVIAAILIYVAVQMIEAEHFVTLFRYERVHFWVAMLVALVTLYKDPIVGILLGATISLIFLLDKISQGQCDISISKRNGELAGSIAGEKTKELDKNTDVLMYSMKGKLCYINSRAHVTRFETKLEKYTYIIIRLREIYFIDLDGVAALDEIIQTAQAKGQTIIITGIAPNVANLLEQTSRSYKELKKNGLVFKQTHEALTYLENTYQLNLHKKTTP